MALIVEDGSIIAGAQAYIDTSYTDTYWENRGNPEEWFCLTLAEQEAAILYGTQYLEKRYKFRGCLIDKTQVLSFPRTVIYDREGRTLNGAGVIPTPVKEASAELALRYVIENYFLDKDPASKRVTRKRIGDAEEDWDNTISTTRFKFIDLLLEDYISGDDSCVRIKRG